MKNLEVGTKVDFYEVVSYKNGVYVLDDGYNKVTIDMVLNKVVFVERNNRCYKAKRFTNTFNFLISSIEELESAEAGTGEADEAIEEVENLTDDLFQESDIAYAEEAIERETCDLQDIVVNIDSSSIGRVVGKNNGKYRIVMSTGKLVELNRNEFYLDNEEPVSQAKEIVKIKVGYYNYEVFENDYVIRFTCRVLDRVFVYNKKFKDFKLMQLSTNRVLLAKRYYTNFYVIITQLQNYILGP